MALFKCNPYLQLGGGSRVISANSFWMRLADVVRALEGFGVVLESFLDLSVPEVEAVADMMLMLRPVSSKFVKIVAKEKSTSALL